MRIKKLSKVFLVGFVVGFAALTGIFSAAAHAANVYNQKASLPVKQVPVIWAGLNADQRQMVDMIAADFFERSLLPAQKIAMVYRTPQQHIRVPVFTDLQEYQKAPFRRFAMDQLELRLSTTPNHPPAYMPKDGSV